MPLTLAREKADGERRYPVEAVEYEAETLNLARELRALPPRAQARALTDVPERTVQDLRYCWRAWARPKQVAPPGNDWLLWLLLAGRGWGKTRVGAELVRDKVERGEWKRVALVAETAADARDVMVEGESGLLAISRPSFMPIYEPSKRQLTWPNGAIAKTYSAEKPGQLRGPQHHGAWADEIAKWKRPDTWNQLMFGLRLGARPQVVATSTPAPVSLVRKLVARPNTVLTRGSTYENRENLAPTFYDELMSEYEGTTLGRQEIHAELMEEIPGALWSNALIEKGRLGAVPRGVTLLKIVIAVDPSGSSGEGAAETGIVVVGLGDDGHAYVLDDRSLVATPNGWATEVVDAYRFWEADRVVAERNFGGEMVETVMRSVDANIPYEEVHAARGKAIRAEPVVSLYERGMVHHVGMPMGPQTEEEEIDPAEEFFARGGVLPGTPGGGEDGGDGTVIDLGFGSLEDQMTTWVPDSGERSPDRLDALVWGVTHLFFPKKRPVGRRPVRARNVKGRLAGRSPRGDYEGSREGSQDHASGLAPGGSARRRSGRSLRDRSLEDARVSDAVARRREARGADPRGPVDDYDRWGER